VGVQLVRAGRTVVAAARDADKARGVLTELGLQEGVAAPDGQARTQALGNHTSCQLTVGP